ncbi:MAG: PQQ-dependent sugar dehydrogenase [Kangiellaceae bacterium]
MKNSVAKNEKSLSLFIQLSLLILLIACGGGGSSDSPDIVDTTPPVITLAGDNPQNINYGSTYIELGASATDAVNGNVSVVITGSVDTSRVGTYQLTYTATDASGNSSNLTRTINVVAARVSNATCVPPPAVGGTPGDITIEASFQDLPILSSPLAMVQPESDSSFWYVALRAGQVVAFDNDPSANSLTEVLDISSKVNTTFELGFTGLAIHPNYPQDNRVFAVYNDANENGRSTISSFSVNTSTRMIDANSELVLITLEQPADNHNGGDIAFGPDGFLYVAFGDGGADRNTSQQLYNLHGSMIRIDVSVQPYQIPSDNPFNSSQSFCSSGARAQGDTSNCPEIFAYGFRNPWRWSFDRQTGDLWLADVGQSTFEEVDRVILGGNYGWPIMEADACFNSQNCDTAGLELPITQYPRSVGVSTVGGYVYRGNASPSMQGLYIWGDTFSSQFLSIPADSNVGADYTAIFNSNRLIAGMAEGNDGEIYLLNLDGGQGDGVYRVFAEDNGTGEIILPDNLSDVGCFDTQNKMSREGVFDYEIHSQLWSDGADKQRSLAIPDNQTIDILSDGDFNFPLNTILMKHFLNGDQYLETRLLINQSNGWTGYSYEWNAEQTDAVLLSDGKTEDVGDFVHTFPSANECAICHTNSANFSLGIETSQLNLTQTALGTNQIDFLSDAGYFSTTVQSENEPMLSAIDDQSASIANRARSYLHSNCAGCHRPGSSAGFMDLRYSTPLAQTSSCDVAPTAGDLGVADARLIAPGNAAASVLVLRMQRLDDDRMPPLASLIEDEVATGVISDWINGLNDCN